MTRGFWQQVAGAFALSAAMLLAAVQPAAAEAPIVRVLLERASGPARVTLPDGSTHQIVASGETGLRLDGRAVGPRWESRQTGAHEFGKWRFPGQIRVLRRGGGLVVVALVPLEDYVAGTVGREMPVSWSAEALRAQAIVSRTYALHAGATPADPDYDLEATVSSQLFGGEAAVVPSVRAAVVATRGEYLVHRGEPILAAFHSASGGRTAGAEEVWGQSLPYLQSQVVEEEDEAPSTYWRATISRTTLRRSLAGLGLDVGADPDLEVLSRWPSGRVRQVRASGDDGARQLSGRLLREALGSDVLKSTLFEVRTEGSKVVIVGSGHGHGVGMSQWGARSMARGGMDHLEILTVFYPGTTLARLPADSAAAALAAGRGE